MNALYLGICCDHEVSILARADDGGIVTWPHTHTRCRDFPGFQKFSDELKFVHGGDSI